MNITQSPWSFPFAQFCNFWHYDTVDGRNPKQPPFGCKKNLVNDGMFSILTGESRIPSINSIIENPGFVKFSTQGFQHFQPMPQSASRQAERLTRWQVIKERLDDGWMYLDDGYMDVYWSIIYHKEQ